MVLAALGLAASRAHGQQACRVDTLSAGFPPQWLGTKVGQITIRARNVEAPNSLIQTGVKYLHRPTRIGVAMNNLSFVSGSDVDSLAVLESVRRLRSTQLYSEVILEGTQCTPGVTDFTVWTRDAWSLRGSYRLSQSGDARASLSEVNLFGTGRTLSAASEMINDRQAFTVAAADPYLFDTRIRASGALRVYSDGRSWSWGLRTRELSPRDLWRVTISSTQLRRFGTDSAEQSFTDITRREDAASVSRLVWLDRKVAWAVVMGVEHQLARLTVIAPGVNVGGEHVNRDFVAPLIGVSLRSLTFGAINWLVPGQPLAELPVGIAGEVAVAIGHDAGANDRIVHYDGWIGGTTLITPGMILTGDIWASGYLESDSLANGELRTSIALYRRARGGMWIFRAGAEHLFNPDPDVFALSSIDPLLHSLAPSSRLAESAIAVGAERSMHLYAKEGRWAIDGAVFAGYSERHRSVDGVTGDVLNLQAVTVGIGLRQVRNQPTQAPVRIDIGRAVWRSGGLPDRWIVVLTTTPWISSGRTRDGLREAR
jgi:hypothetical protein